MSTTTKTSKPSKVGAVNTKPTAAKKAAPSKPAPVAVEAPKAAAGTTVIRLRSERNTEIVSAHTTVKGAIKVDGPFVIVTNAKAQELFDQLNDAGKSAAIFDRRVLDYFTAALAIARPTVKDARTSVHAKVLAAGRDGLKSGALQSFGFEMKTDGTLRVQVQPKGKSPVLYGTQREALAALAA